MVIPFPAAVAAPQPISGLLAKCIEVLAASRLPSPAAQRLLLQQLKQAQQAELIALPAPVQRPFKHFHDSATSTNYSSRTGGYCFQRHSLGSNGRWTWLATRIDDEHHEWSTYGFAVIDDFGSLVEVPA